MENKSQRIERIERYCHGAGAPCVGPEARPGPCRLASALLRILAAETYAVAPPAFSPSEPHRITVIRTSLYEIYIIVCCFVLSNPTVGKFFDSILLASYLFAL
jgi:hypothetical protein